MLNQGAAAVVMITLGFALFNLPSFGRPDPAKFPSAAIRAIPAGCTLFNEYDFGGLVILERPDVLVSLDSRNDLYGAEQVTHHSQILSGQGDLSSGLMGADCVLVRPASNLTAWLEASSDWSLSFAGSAAELYIRR
jgi:hypothetical protein